MHACVAERRGRSAKAQIYCAKLADENGNVFSARGLCAGGEGFERGEFIGFYTGAWTSSERTARGAYTVAFGDDMWKVVPPRANSKTWREHEHHAMAAINEPSTGVRAPPHTRLPSLSPPRIRLRHAAVVQERANAVFKRYSAGSHISALLRGEVRAIAVHAADRIKPWEPILVHYGDEYRRLYAVGDPCADVPMRACQRPAEAMGVVPLPHDAFVALL